VCIASAAASMRFAKGFLWRFADLRSTSGISASDAGLGPSWTSSLPSAAILAA
jgi:hypothetical protein